MADPLSISASVAGLLALGLQSTEYLYKFYTSYRDRDQDLFRVADKLGGLLQSLEIIDNIVQTRKWRVDEEFIVKNIERSLKRCEDLIVELQDETQKFQKEPKADAKKTIVIAGRRAIYPFRRSTLEKLGEDVDDFRSNLSLALEALQLKEHQIIQNDQEDLMHFLKTVQAEHVAISLRQWLNAPNSTTEYNHACNKRHPGTGQWFIQSPAFASWLQRNNTFLWLYGFAGCGKSVLCSTAIQHTVRCKQTQSRSAIAFFFFTFDDERKKDASSVLRALLLQLCGQVPNLETDLKQLQSNHNHSMPPVSTLIEYLREAIVRCCHVYILLDALDEIPEDTARAGVLSMIENMRQWQLPGLHLLVTSRDTPDVRGCLDSQRDVPYMERVPMKNDSIDQDIHSYVSYQVDHDRELRCWSDANRQRIKDHLIQHASGVFRWVECQIGPLKNCPRSVKHLNDCLKSLPKSLEETYERVLCSIDEKLKDDARRILSLLCYAPRPLSVGEVIEALAVDVDDLKRYDKDRKLSGAADILRICPNLIEISFLDLVNDVSDFENGEEDAEDVTRVREVRIGHFSVQEYLMSDRVKPDFALSASVEHAQITETCALYLTNEDFLTQALRPQLIRQYPFAQYAARYWHDHYRQADKKSVPQLLTNVVAILTDRLAFERWARLYNADEPWNRQIKYKSTRVHGSPLYCAALLGLDDILTPVLSTLNVDINAKGGKYGTALQAASYEGHEKVVQILLDNGAEVHFKERPPTTLRQAVFDGNMEMVMQMVMQMVLAKLLDKVTQVLAQRGDYGFPLAAPSHEADEKMVQMMLEKVLHALAPAHGGGEHGITFQVGSCEVDEKMLQQLQEVLHLIQRMLNKVLDDHSEGGEYDIALQEASLGVDEKVVQQKLQAVLSDPWASFHVEEGRGGTASRAVSYADKESMMAVTQVIVLGMLFWLDVEDDDEGLEEYHTALQAASYGGHEKVVQMLLDKGADVNAWGGRRGAALQGASGNGHEKVVRILLDKGADVHAEGGYYGTALQAAAHGGHEKVVQMLLDKGADIHAEGGYCGTALQEASQGGHETVVQMLLHNGADIHARAGHGGTALQEASHGGHRTVVQMLLDNGADVNTVGGQGGTALQKASPGDHGTVVQMLLNNGADVNTVGGHHDTALQAASHGGHEQVVQMLLDHGANVNTVGGYHGTALQAASHKGHEQVVQMLLDRSVDVNAWGGHYGTALQAAAHGGHEHVVQMLLDRGADINAKGGNWYGTALQAASIKGSERLVQMLIDDGADVNAQGGDMYGTAIQAAAIFEQEQIVQMLLDNGAEDEPLSEHHHNVKEIIEKLRQSDLD